MKQLFLERASKDEYYIFDVELCSLEITKNLNNFKNDKIFCFDLSKYPEILSDELQQTLYDIQALAGLSLKKINSLDDILSDELKCTLAYFRYLKSYQICNTNYSKFDNKIMFDLDTMQEYFSCCFEQMKLKNFLSFPEQNTTYYERFYKHFKKIILIKEAKINYKEKNKELKQIKLNYNIFGNKNSRLSIRKNHLNIYSLNKNDRDCILPYENQRLYQFDYKNFQPRIAFALYADKELKEQMSWREDIYSFFPGSRDEVKIDLISWMFSSRKHELFDSMCSSLLRNKKLLHEKSKNICVKNAFGRPLYFHENEPEGTVFQNIISSCETDLMFQVCSAVYRLCLQSSPIHILFPFHDCIVFSIDTNSSDCMGISAELELVSYIKEEMENTCEKLLDFKFPVEVKSGINFAEMNDLHKS